MIKPNYQKMKSKFIFYIFCLTTLFFIHSNEIAAQAIPAATRNQISAYLTDYVNKTVKTGRVKIKSVDVSGTKVVVNAGVNLSYIPFRDNDVEEIYTQIKKLLPAKYKNFDIEVMTDTQEIKYLVPTNRSKKHLFENEVDKPLITNISKPYIAEKGLKNRHLALWQSHGWYYEQKLNRWEWQRARVFQTVEDLYTQSYVLPYLVPMLENAGANVFLPRERDYQKHEVIIDNNGGLGSSIYQERAGKEAWIDGKAKGFAHKKATYLDGENPFKMGTYRRTETITSGEESTCEWIPDIPERGQYGVYISYQSAANSTEDAHYTVHHAGGKTDFHINQKMGGGTWIFLGFFEFEKGMSDKCKVVLTNKSQHAGHIITSDAVKIGGGMGNIARLPHPNGIFSENTKSSETPKKKDDKKEVKKLPPLDYKPEISGYPRYTEGARYWLQWAGMPDTIYNRNESQNDYVDDYQSRGHWVNYMSGGSSVAPKRNGLKIPIDMALAFHSDAGTTYNDSIIGTLGICMTLSNNKRFENGKSRWTSRDLTDRVMEEVVQDIRRKYEPNWTRRYIWNKSYSEANVPNVPTMLLELLSHHNFADMKYGMDPRFRFTVSRSVYKGILKFVSHQYEKDYVVQPLPVKSFSVEFSGDTQVNLKWTPVSDETEPTATPEKYIVYTRIDNGGFDNGKVVEGTHATITITKDKIYSFKVTAANKGGESFPSEILSVCRKTGEKGMVLIINGFDRLSAPQSFSTSDGLGGFLDFIDHGVPDKVEYNYTGSQYEFRRSIPWMDDDAPGFGGSNSNFETTVIAGNTFDYPALYGQSIAKAGFSFVSVSRDAVTDGKIDMNTYKTVSLILGKQKQTKIGRGLQPAEFKTFPKALQEKISAYCNQGGNIFVSGAYIASDLWDTENPQSEDQAFASNILKYKWRAGRAAVTGEVKSVLSPFASISGKFDFYTTPNSISYAVESPDAIEPEGDDCYTIFRYSENNLSAGIAYKGTYKTCVLGFPFETIKEEKNRDSLMKGILQLFSE